LISLCDPQLHINQVVAESDMITRRSRDGGLFDKVGFLHFVLYGLGQIVREEVGHRHGYLQVVGKVGKSSINVSGFLRRRIRFLIYAEERDLFAIEPETTPVSIPVDNIDGYPVWALQDDLAGGAKLQLLPPDLIDIVADVCRDTKTLSFRQKVRHPH